MREGNKKNIPGNKCFHKSWRSSQWFTNDQNITIQYYLKLIKLNSLILVEFPKTIYKGFLKFYLYTGIYQ